MKPTLTSTPKKALWWIIAALLIALMPSVALSGSIHFAIVNISSVSPVAEGSTDHFITIDVQMTGILLDGDTATVDYVLQGGSATSSSLTWIGTALFSRNRAVCCEVGRISSVG